MKLKLTEIDGKTYAEVTDGKPVYVHDDGSEKPFDAAHTVQTITRLNGEAMSHRTYKEEAEAKLKAFDGIEDPAGALKAIETVKNLDSQKLVDAGKLDELKDELSRSFEAKYEPTVAENAQLKQQLHGERMGNAFANSKFIQDNLIIPADMAKSTFGNCFSVEDGKMVAKDLNGNPIYSKERPAEGATFDEAIAVLVDQYPHKDSILKASGHSGSDAEPNRGANGQTISIAAAGGDQGKRQQAIASRYPELPAS